MISKGVSQNISRLDWDGRKGVLVYISLSLQCRCALTVSVKVLLLSGISELRDVLMKHNEFLLLMVAIEINTLNLP